MKINTNAAVVSVWEWDEPSHTCLFKFENSPDGANVQIEW